MKFKQGLVDRRHKDQILAFERHSSHRDIATIYRRDQEQIVPLRLPNMGLKGGSGSSWVCPVLGVVVVFLP